MGRLIDVDKFLKKVKKDREHEIYLHSWTADMVLERLNSWYAPPVEAIPKADYEARLKADMVAMLTEIQLEIKELWDNRYDVWLDNQYYIGKSDTLEEIDDIIQQKIDALKGEQEAADDKK